MLSEEGTYQNAVKTVDVSMYFGKVKALEEVNFHVGANEVIGLIGDNGAGNSTLIKIITGVLTPTVGELYIRDEKINLNKYNVKQAHRLRIETVYQDRSLAEKQAIWRNFFIGRQLTGPLGFLKVSEEKRIANEILLNMIGFRGAGISADSIVAKLSGGERQGVSIGRAMYFDADLIILDEPTIALSLKEVRKVLNFVHQIKKGGKACIYVSHNITDVYEISDRFVIFDRGRLVAAIKKEEISQKSLNTFLLDYAHGLKENEEQ